MSRTEKLPLHIGGYQKLEPDVICKPDDIYVLDGIPLLYVGADAGKSVYEIEKRTDYRIYRKIPCPRQGGERPTTAAEVMDEMKQEQPKTEIPGLKDSGTRTTYETGAQRDAQENKGRFDLLPLPAIMAYAKLLEKGAKKYSERNWEKGIPISRFFDGALRHLFKAQAGATDEDHLAAAMFNVGGIIFTRHQIARGKLPKELDDMPEPVYTGEEF